MNDAPILRLGFVGLGQAVNRMFRQYPDVKKLPYRVTAAAEPREHALEKFRKDFGGEGFRSVEELCESPNVDVVYIATPPEMHLDHVRIAAEHGKHMVVEKPLALSIADCDAMVNMADKHGVKLLAGHTHSFDAPIRKIREIVESGVIGDVVMINTWNFNEFNPRPWPTGELNSTFGPVLNQGPHQVDVVRQIMGRKAVSLRAQTIWDPLRKCVGGYSCFLQFENGTPATLIYDARGFFDVAELYWWVAEGGSARDPGINVKMRKNFHELNKLGEEERERILETQKEQGRYGVENADPRIWQLWGYSGPEEIQFQPFFGLTLVSCERGAIRQSKNGLLVYGEDGVEEISLGKELRGRAAELMDLYNGIVHGKPIFHDGRWGKATLEICLAILESARDGKEIKLSHQTVTGH
jgi:phthalate 4,5-cis-dihydrodiol dehydrogenase